MRVVRATLLENLTVMTLLGLAILPATAGVAATGDLLGLVVGEDDQAIAGVLVTVVELDETTLTGDDGSYLFPALPAGTWTVSFSLGAAAASRPEIVISAEGSTRLDHKLDFATHFGETLTVTSASRYRESLLEAPAAMTVVTADEIASRAPTSQVPKLLENAPGVELTQSGLYDFNLNTRGFNGPLSRRILVLIDGRDPSIPFLGAQEWGAFSLPLDDLESLELVRGPSAALYGANASSGVLNIVTRPPHSSAGGTVRLTAGELDTTHLDFRWAGALGRQRAGDGPTGWWKVLAGHRSSRTFSVSRRGTAEYSVPCSPPAITRRCLPQEAVDPADRVDGWAGSLRFDKNFSGGLSLTLEAGNSAIDGVTVLTNLGRNTFVESERPWARASLAHPRGRALATWSGRDAPTQTPLNSGLNFALDSEHWTLEAQTDLSLGERVRLVIGGSFRDESADSFDPGLGAQTLLFEPAGDTALAAFAQLEWRAASNLKLVLASRWDDSDTFYSDELSPKASLVWSPRPRHTLRISYNQAFQAANYAEKLLQGDVAAGLPMHSLETFCTPWGISCGFGNTPLRQLAVGNPDLDVEKVRTVEVGYRAVLGRSAFLTLAAYRSDNENFITDLLPEHTTPLGDINRFFGPYRPPADLPAPAAESLLAALAQALGPRLPFLTNNHDGSPFLALLTYGSFGEVASQGVEVAGHYSLGRRFRFSASASTFDFDLESSLPGLDEVLSPNAPELQARASMTYVGEHLNVELSGRWVDGFFWSSGVFTGDVPSYSTFDLSAVYRQHERLSFGLNVSNLFDNDHYEAFGGDLIGRRALGNITVRW